MASPTTVEVPSFRRVDMLSSLSTPAPALLKIPEPLSREATASESSLESADDLKGRPSFVFRNIQAQQSLDKWYMDRLKYMDQCSSASAAAHGAHPSKTEEAPLPLCLISGPNGSGRRSLFLSKRASSSSEFCSQIAARNGFVIRGHFNDCLPEAGPTEPFAAFGEAFGDYARQVVARGGSLAATVRQKVRRHVRGETNLQTLLSIFPSLQPLLVEENGAGGGTERDIASNAAKDAILEPAVNSLVEVPSAKSSVMGKASCNKRFVLVFQNFVEAICSTGHPIVLVVHNLHFSDECSLECLGRFLTEDIPAALSVVGICEPASLEQGSPLNTRLLSVAKKMGKEIPRVDIANMTEAQVTVVTQGALGYGDSSTQELAQFLFRQTGGSLFYLDRLLGGLFDDALITKESGRWEWDMDEIEATACDSLNSFLRRCLRDTLPKASLEVLEAGSCLGTRFRTEVIEKILDTDVVSNSLRFGTDAEVLKVDAVGHCFVHEHVKNVIHDMIIDKDLFHAEIARRLWRTLSSDELDQHIFTVLAQFRRGKESIHRSNEQTAVARLCLHAAKKAALASSFHVASTYLELGIDLLDMKGWSEEYELTLSLHNFLVEMLRCTARFDDLSRVIADMMAHTQSEMDKATAYTSHIYLLAVTDEQDKAVDLGVNVLRKLGENMPARLCTLGLLKEMKSVLTRVKKMSSEQILRLPMMTQTDKLCCCRVLQMMYFHSILARPKLMPFFTLMALRLSLDYGISAMSAEAFACFGVLCILKGHIEQGYRFGRLALALLDKFGAIEHLPRVYGTYYTIIHIWKHPVDETLAPLRRGHHVGVLTGDFEYASYCAKSFCMNAFVCGVPLNELYKQWTAYHDSMVSSGQHLTVSVLKPFADAMHYLVGKTGAIDEFQSNLDALAERGLSRRLKVALTYRLLTSYIFCDYVSAGIVADRTEELALPFNLPSPVDILFGRFFLAMTALARAEQKVKRRKNLIFVRKCIRELKKGSSKSPHNFLCQQFLLEAELDAVLGKTESATKKFVCAIALARDSKSFLYLALANERAARHALRSSDLVTAVSHLSLACHTYKEWGATAKVLFLQIELNQLTAQLPKEEALGTSSPWELGIHR